jgi:transposase InsO family protein
MVEDSVAQGSQSISQACETLSVPRTSFYRQRGLSLDAIVDIELRDEIQRIALEMSVYGYRRITAELKRRELIVNHKRVLRIMREDNLLCLRKKRYILTTDSEHGLPVYPNLVPELNISGINQLWVADITYVRLHREYVYLAVVLDVYSRRALGWNLGRRLDSELCIAALEMALETRDFPPGLVHHSDRGVQYASKEYTDLLKGNNIDISMSRKGNPYDNAYAESFMKTLKYEEVYLSDYCSYEDACESIGYFIEQVYNLKRLHSSLGYLPPVEYEQILAVST